MRWMVSIAGETVSPVLEQCGTLLCVDSDGEARRTARRLAIPRGECAELIAAVRREAPDVLLCGALCPQLYCMIGGGIEVRPFLCGDVEDLLDLCLQCRPIPEQHVLPGCGPLADRRLPLFTSWITKPVTRGEPDGS